MAAPSLVSGATCPPLRNASDVTTDDLLFLLSLGDSLLYAIVVVVNPMRLALQLLRSQSVCPGQY